VSGEEGGGRDDDDEPPTHTLSCHALPSLTTSPILPPAPSPLLLPADDKTVVVWDPTTSEARQQFSFHSAPVLTCAWGTDTTFASAGTDKAVHVCALGERAPSRTFAGHVDEVNSVAWSPNASRGILASGSDDGTVRVWSMASPSGADACLATLVGSARDAGSGSPSASASAAARRSVYQVAWSPTGEGTRNASKQAQIASACFDGTVKVWDVGTLKARGTPALFTLQRHAALVYALAYSPDGDYLATAGADRSVNIYSAADGSLVRTYLGPAAAFDAAFSPAGNRLAVAFASGVTTVIDLRR
jgi:transducin (beta)-like 1